MTLIDRIKSAKSREELHKELSSSTIEMRYIMLKNAIEHLDKEISCDIEVNHIDLALYKMSQVVILEDELHVVERIILKRGVLVR